VCIEITPACDHAGNKSHLARVLCGILVRIDGNAVKESDLKLPPSSRLFAKELEPLWIDNEAMQLKGVFKLMINARCLLSISLNELRQKKAVFRLRYPVVCDIQAWFASHAARPGYVSVH
jgi:hypothetical protein